MTSSTPEIAPVSVVIIDDSELVRAGLTALLSSSAAIKVLGQADTVATGVATVEKLKPDIALLDIRLPDVDDAIRAGAHGYLLKEVNGAALIQAIVNVAAGQSILDPAITARVLALMRSNTPTTRGLIDSLSPQEKRVLAQIAEGKTNKEVASALGLAEKTVKNYLGTVFEKLHVSRRTQAAAIYAKSQK